MKHYSIIALLLMAVTAAAWGQEPICPPGGTIYQVGHVLYRHPPGGRASGGVAESRFFAYNGLRFAVDPLNLSGVRSDGLHYRALTIKVVLRDDESRDDSTVYEFVVPDELNRGSSFNRNLRLIVSGRVSNGLRRGWFWFYLGSPNNNMTKYPSLIYTGDVCMWREDMP